MVTGDQNDEVENYLIIKRYKFSLKGLVIVVSATSMSDNNVHIHTHTHGQNRIG